MPANMRPVVLEAAWPWLCPEGRQLRYNIEKAIDYVEKAKGTRQVSAKAEKDAAEDALTAHIAQCSGCTDRVGATRLRFRLRPRRQSRGARKDRSRPREPFRPRRDDGQTPSRHPAVQYALWRL